MWLYKRRKRKRGRRQPTAHYLAHKEVARAFIHARLAVFNVHYGFAYKRVAIKNQRSCWGSCSAQGNLNFNYRLSFLPSHIADYIIVHELCHLAELNHSVRFWSLVSQRCPEYKAYRRELKAITTHGVSYLHGSTMGRATIYKT
jgi:predicted metal-dependent hydrolase